jgi:hypothetical protein
LASEPKLRRSVFGRFASRDLVQIEVRGHSEFQFVKQVSKGRAGT